MSYRSGSESFDVPNVSSKRCGNQVEKCPYGTEDKLNLLPWNHGDFVRNVENVEGQEDTAVPKSTHRHGIKP